MQWVSFTYCFWSANVHVVTHNCGGIISVQSALQAYMQEYVCTNCTLEHMLGTIFLLWQRWLLIGQFASQVTDLVGVIEDDCLVQSFKQPDMIINGMQCITCNWFPHVIGIFYHNHMVFFVYFNAQRQFFDLFANSELPKHIIMNFYNFLELGAVKLLVVCTLAFSTHAQSTIHRSYTRHMTKLQIHNVFSEHHGMGPQLFDSTLTYFWYFQAFYPVFLMLLFLFFLAQLFHDCFDFGHVAN